MAHAFLVKARVPRTMVHGTALILSRDSSVSLLRLELYYVNFQLLAL